MAVTMLAQLSPPQVGGYIVRLQSDFIDGRSTFIGFLVC